jgi:hypothetical protein
MLPLAHAGLTTPAVAGPGCNEWLGLSAAAPNCAKLVEPDSGEEAEPASPRTGRYLPKGMRKMRSKLKAAAVHVEAITDDCAEKESGKLVFPA